jgi:hypothetical protein
MDKVNAKMVERAEKEFNNYCMKHGDMGKVQVALEETMLELRKAYALRKNDIRMRLVNKNVVKFTASDDFMSFAAFNVLFERVWQLVADIVIAYEDNNAKDLDAAIRAANDEDRIKIGKLLINLR